MLKQTRILNMLGPDDPEHICDCNELLPNICVGMQIQVESTKYRVTDIRMIVDIEFCRQTIFVEEL